MKKDLHSLPRPTPELVLFDLGGVLVDVDMSRALAAWSKITDQPHHLFEEALFASGLKESMDKGLTSTEECVATLSNTFPLSTGDFSEVWEEVLKVRPAMISLLNRILEESPCGLLSNTDPIHHRWAQNSIEPLGRFIYQFVSYEEGCWKPEPLFYKKILAQIGLAPGKVFFVDDLPKNVEGAKRAGLDAVLFVSRVQLVKDLRVRGFHLRGEDR